MSDTSETPSVATVVDHPVAEPTPRRDRRYAYVFVVMPDFGMAEYHFLFEHETRWVHEIPHFLRFGFSVFVKKVGMDSSEYREAVENSRKYEEEN